MQTPTRPLNPDALRPMYEALKRAAVLLDAARRVIEDYCDDVDFSHVDGIPTDNIGFSTDCENAVDRALAALALAEKGDDQ